MRRIGSLFGCGSFIVWTFSSGNIPAARIEALEIIRLLHGLAVARFGSIFLIFPFVGFLRFGGSEGEPVICSCPMVPWALPYDGVRSNKV
ncbi:hypothetical protein HOY80DRAFT_993382 [Tuber brumale]|nr:hypothetical protein HOY80DRAFT_993382 [Tuber brumale]